MLYITSYLCKTQISKNETKLFTKNSLYSTYDIMKLNEQKNGIKI